MAREISEVTPEAVQKWTEIAVRMFWEVRARQKAKNDQSEARNAGNRGAATGGGHLDEFVFLFEAIAKHCGYSDDEIFHKSKLELPGYFRPTKKWDFLVIRNGHLIAAIECKGQVGSFGNNINNRIEEALGNAEDVRVAFREKSLGKNVHRPWLGFFLLLEKAQDSTKQVDVYEPHFLVRDEFIDPNCVEAEPTKKRAFGAKAGRRGVSYAERYHIFGEKLVLEGLYSAASIILADQANPGAYNELTNLEVFQFVVKFRAHLMAMGALIEQE